MTTLFELVGPRHGTIMSWLTTMDPPFRTLDTSPSLPSTLSRKSIELRISNIKSPALELFLSASFSTVPNPPNRYACLMEKVVVVGESLVVVVVVVGNYSSR